MQPEYLRVANSYIEHLDKERCARDVGLDVFVVREILDKKEVKEYIRDALGDMGYSNNYKLHKLVDRMIESKLQEAEETGILTTKDLLEVVKLKHSMGIEERKATQPQTQVNIQYADLLRDLIQGESNEKT